MATTGNDTYQWTDGAGNVLNLSDSTHFLVMPSDGFGMPDLDAVNRESPYQPGANWVYTKPKPHEFTLNVVMKAPDWASQQNLRDELLDAFSPANGRGTLTVFRANGTQRAIDCVLKGGLKFDASGRKGMNRIEKIELRADWPFFYDPTAVSVSVSSTGAAATIVVRNNGNWEAWPLITFTPGATGVLNPTFACNGKTISYSGTVAASTQLTLDATVYNPQIFTGTSTSQWSNLASSTTFFSILPKQNNSVVITGDGTHSFTASVTFKQQYLGI